MYLVIEIHEREFGGLHIEKSRQAAFDKANSLMEAYCEQKDMAELYERAALTGSTGEFPEQMSLAGDGPDRDATGAWANIKDEHWDAHVVPVGAPDDRQSLSILLKELCRVTMNAPGSGCGDGTCDDCPVNRVLETLQGTANE